jgi:c(7)-type cytochrome triheme protein
MRQVIRLAVPLLAAILFAGTAAAVQGDVVQKRKPGADAGLPESVFPHWIHRIRYRCYACHDALFKMARTEGDDVMGAIAKGQSCGACHDGKTAWGVSFETCNRCHVAR